MGKENNNTAAFIHGLILPPLPRPKINDHWLLWTEEPRAFALVPFSFCFANRCFFIFYQIKLVADSWAYSVRTHLYALSASWKIILLFDPGTKARAGKDGRNSWTSRVINLGFTKNSMVPRGDIFIFIFNVFFSEPQWQKLLRSYIYISSLRSSWSVRFLKLKKSVVLEIANRNVLRIVWNCS